MLNIEVGPGSEFACSLQREACSCIPLLDLYFKLSV